METISRFLLVFLINAIWQAPAVMLAASLCDRVMRNAPARFRHWLWVIALVICLALPLSSLTGIGQPSAPGSSSSAIAIEEGDASQRSAFANGVNELWRRNFLSIQPAPLAPSPALTFAVLSCYLLSLLCHLAKIRRSWLRTNEIRADAYEREIPEPMAQVAARCRSAFGARDIPILSSAGAPSPLTLGIFRPVVILPESLFDSASTETLTSALGHEMAHIRRRDFALNIIYELLCLPIAFHPAVALVKRRINQTRELACDEMVTDNLMDARAYAKSLVDLAALAPNLGRPIHGYNQPLGVLDADILEERVMRMIEKKPRLSAKRAVALLISTSLALTISSAAASTLSLSLSQDKGAKPNFSGKWKSESTVNEVGDMPFPPGYKGEMIDIDHKDPELKVIKTIEAGDKIVVELSYTTDGKEKANTWGNVPARSKINWNGRQMIISTSIETASGSVESKETWDLGDDQKTLIITREFMNSRAKTVCKRQ